MVSKDIMEQVEEVTVRAHVMRLIATYTEDANGFFLSSVDRTMEAVASLQETLEEMKENVQVRRVKRKAERVSDKLLTAEEWDVVVSALAYYETSLEDENDEAGQKHLDSAYHKIRVTMTEKKPK